jgi:Family of unknown function (DUF5994)
VSPSSPGFFAPPLPPNDPRLRLRANVGSGFVDGGWWPRSGDLSAELPPLLMAMWSAGHQVYRVTSDLASWQRPPRHTTVSGRRVKVDGYRSDPATISLVDQSGWKRIDLVVIPAATDAQAAHRWLSPGRTATCTAPPEILHRAASKPPTQRSRPLRRRTHALRVGYLPHG